MSRRGKRLRLAGLIVGIAGLIIATTLSFSREGASQPYHVWDFDGYAEGVYMDL